MREWEDVCQRCNTVWLKHNNSDDCETFVSVQMLGWVRDLPIELYPKLVERLWRRHSVTDTGCWE